MKKYDSKEIDLKFISPNELELKFRKAMYALMCKNYAGVKFDEFNNDLNEKDFIMVGLHHDVPIGFTTGKWFDIKSNNHFHKILFSGDTIIDKEYRGNPIWITKWVKFVLDQAQLFEQDTWWMLTSKGHLTYRYLPICFKNFYPNHLAKTPLKVKAIQKILGRKYAGNDYNQSNDIVIHNNGQRLIKDPTIIPKEASKQNKHVKFFLDRNPDWLSGNELLCLANLKRDNFQAKFLSRIT